MTVHAQVTVRKKGNWGARIILALVALLVRVIAKARAADLIDGKPDLDGKADNG
jgi:hypothetical protein